MRHITVTLTLVLGTLGCSDEADIGMDSEPVGCLDTAQGEVHGTVTNPYDGADYEWGPSSVTLDPLNPASPTLVYLTDTGGTTGSFVNQLRFTFYCGSEDEGEYAVIGQENNIQASCPYAVTGTITGRIEVLVGEDGVLIVDEATECLAGRFSVDFGDNGALAGWFSAPWPDA